LTELLKMREALAFLGILAVSVSLWFLRGDSDNKLIESKDATIQSLLNAVQSKEDIQSKNNVLIDSRDATIKLLQDNLQTKADALGKDQALIDSQNAMIKSLQETVQSNDAVISKDNDLISSYQNPPLSSKNDQERDDLKIYPADNGFDAQDLGSGFSAYQVFGPVKNPSNNKLPDRIPNHTPWKFGGGNSGIAANGCAYYVNGATNLDSDGSTSTNGQAGCLEYADSSISQTIKLPAGTFTVTFDYEGRRNYSSNKIAVSIDGTVLFRGAPNDCDHFKRITTDSITLTAAGKHELMFRALGGIGDNSAYPCTFIDNIYLNVVSSQAPTSPPVNPIIEMDDAGPRKGRTHL
jgi:hypothetical protein